MSDDLRKVFVDPSGEAGKAAGDSRRTVRVRRVDECESMDEIFLHCLPAFGGAYLRRIYPILDRAIGMGCPLTLAIAGPVTVSGQHQTWLIPLLETGWVAYLQHHRRRLLPRRPSQPGRRHKSAPSTKSRSSATTRALRDEGTIRVTDMAFDEDVLLDQDRFLSAVLARPEFQKQDDGHRTALPARRVSMPRRRSRTASRPDCSPPATAAPIPIFVGAPGDGSVFLNSMKLWAMQQAGLIPDYGFDLDLHAEVFEACAYHHWGLFDNPVACACAPSFSAAACRRTTTSSPSPRSARCSALPNMRGYNFDVQIVTAPVTDGSLSSCPPAEAVTWGKVDKDTYHARHREHAGRLLDGHAVYR